MGMGIGRNKKITMDTETNKTIISSCCFPLCHIRFRTNQLLFYKNYKKIFNFKVFAVYFNVNKMNHGSYSIYKNHPVVLHRNMHILHYKLRCDTAYFKPWFSGNFILLHAYCC
jgi:hypothetical protein